MNNMRMTEDFYFDQGGSNILPLDLYKNAAKHITLPGRVANFGSGTHFAFEHILHKLSPETIINSYDIADVKLVPDFVQYRNHDLTKPIESEDLFDTVTFFELIEHVDNTDMIFQNARRNLKQGGGLVFSFPNLASLLCRVSLLLGYQPHILEVSNIFGNFGSGLLGRWSNPSGKPVHHVRGITLNAMIELVKYHGFEVIKIVPYEYRLGRLPGILAGISPVIIMICKKSSRV